MTLVKTIAGNDDVKNALYESGLVEIIVEIVNAIDERKGKLKDQSGVCIQLNESFLLLLATLTLRHPGIVSKLLDYNILDTILNLVKQHSANIKIVKYAAWNIRNICVRNRTAAETACGLGAVELLEECLKVYRV
ncbi:uncharacterized protein LOC103514703 [Diaphorina citri]|uniref:Uncharacterized protein LOC103514703 n=1 Tax=Diaphorina citri TaxID=121845 RepID=A0A3Q0J4P5_DIACI|nr:uncharacterized protein LOC103514703 [Diaphorina citri]